MGLKQHGKPAIDRATSLCQELVAAVGPKDRLTLALSSAPKEPLLREVDVVDPDTVKQLLEGLKPTDTYTAWNPTMLSLDTLVMSSTYPIREVTVITDLRRAGWDKELTEQANRWAADGVRLRIFDVGGGYSKQLSLENLTQSDRLVLANVPAQWTATVRNASTSELKNVEATFLVDGSPTQIILPTMAAGETIRVPLTATFREAGLHHVALKLPDDDLAGDNQRWSVVDVKETLQILLVDGEPSSEPLGNETDFLALALSLPIGESSAFEVQTVSDAEWAGLSTADPDLLILANVPRVSSEQADRLQRCAESGVGVVIFAGDQIDPDNYNQELYRNGEGILPAALEFIADEPVTGLLLEDNSPSPIDSLRQLNAAVLERIKTNKHFQLRLADPPPKDTRVLARWNNPASTPAVLERRIGAGSVLFWTTTADKGWSDWPTEPSYVLAQRETSKTVARSGRGLHTLTAGEPLRRALSADLAINQPTVELPGAPEPTPLTLERSTSAETGGNSLVIEDTAAAGLYRLNWQSTPGGATSDLFAVNPDARESNLDRMSQEELRKRWGNLSVEIISATSDDDAPITVRGEEIWRPLAIGLLALACIETCFATWAGRQR
jgi:hypothetical protein